MAAGAVEMVQYEGPADMGRHFVAFLKQKEEFMLVFPVLKYILL